MVLLTLRKKQNLVLINILNLIGGMLLAEQVAALAVQTSTCIAGGAKIPC